MKAMTALGTGWSSLSVSVTIRVAFCLLLMLLLILPSASLAQPAPQWIDVEGAEGAKLQAVVLRPSGDGPFPIVILLHGGSGMVEETVSWGLDLSRAGFLAIAPCFFRRPVNPDPSLTPLSVCLEAPDRWASHAVWNLTAAIETARRLPGARRDRVGLVGASWGGAVALVAASSGVEVQAVVALAPPPTSRLTNNDPAAWSVVERLNARVLILQGTNDNSVPVGSVRQLEARLRELGKSVESHYFEGGGHLFMLDPRFRADVIGRTVAFLERHLGR